MKRRVVTALAAIPAVLALVGCTHPGPLACLVFLACLLCLVETNELFDFGASDGVGLLAIGAATLATAAGVAAHQIGNLPSEIPIFGGISLWLAGMIASFSRAKSKMGPFWRFFSAFWYAAPLLACLFLHTAKPLPLWEWSLRNPLLMVLLPVWAGDTAAMLGGRMWGKHPLAPKISPKKTWEGAASNFVASTLVGLATAALLGYSAVAGLLCGVSVGVLGQLGDLFESALKRSVDKKDSGTLLPGHGGVLDRIDALIACVLPVWLILWASHSL